jgi:D-alanine-D-alanine ligase
MNPKPFYEVKTIHRIKPMLDYRVLILYRLPGGQLRCEFQQTHEADEAIQLVDSGLSAAGFDTQIILVGDDIEQVLADVDPRASVIFNYCEGYHENNSGYDPITRLYESLNLVYTGADDHALWHSQNKAHAKAQLVRHGVKTPIYRIYETDDVAGWDIFPAIVKPAHLHASLGILPESVVETPRELRHQVQRILDELQQPALVEDFIEGDEFRACVLGNHEFEVLPLIRYQFLTNTAHPYVIKDFATKWDDDALDVEIPAKISGRLRQRIETTAKAAFRAVGARDYGGFDIRVRAGTPYVIDANQNPDIADGCSFLLALRTVGRDYSALASKIVSLAAQRLPEAVGD